MFEKKQYILINKRNCKIRFIKKKKSVNYSAKEFGVFCLAISTDIQSRCISATKPESYWFCSCVTTAKAA